MQLIESIVANATSIADVRRDLHAHPELCFEEVRTSDLIASKLAAWGIEVHRGLGTTGVVGIVRNGTSNRAVGLRADIDALPMTEQAYFTSSKALRRSASLVGWWWSMTHTTSIRGFEAAFVQTVVRPELSLRLPRLSVCPWLPDSPVARRCASTDLSCPPFDARLVVDDDVVTSLIDGIASESLSTTSRKKTS